MTKKERHVIAINDKYISLTIEAKDDVSLSWEYIQEVKDKYYHNLYFIEVYPEKENIINKANVRHLVHVRGWSAPQLSDLELVSDIIVNDL